MVNLPFADPLKTACRHCATIARARTAEMFKRRLVPRQDDDTATVTFIKLEGRTYAVTAWHVIEIFCRQAVKDNVAPEAYVLPAAPGVILQPPLLRPPALYMMRQPDIGLRRVPDDLPGQIGKEAFEVRKTPAPTFPISHALAVGFPTASKRPHAESGGKRLELPCVWAVAEGVGGPKADQVQFFSELEQAPEGEALSGMSGGPVFWSDDEAYGLLGFVKEAPAVAASGGGEALTNRPRVQIMCQRASYDDLLRWTAYAEAEWPGARAALNAACSGQ